MTEYGHAMNRSLRSRKPWIAAAVLAVAFLTGACGGSDDESTESGGSNQSSPAAGAASTGDLSAVFAEIPGYDLAALPPEALESARAAYAAQVQQAGLPPDVVQEIDGRIVNQDGQEVARALGLSFDPTLSSEPGFHEGFVKAAAGQDSSSVQLSGRQARTFAAPDGPQGVIFSEGRMALIVFDQRGSGADLEGIMSELMANA